MNEVIDLSKKLSAVPLTDQQKRIEEATSKNDNTKWTPADMLRAALLEHDAGKWEGDKALIIIIDTKGGKHFNYRCNVNDLEFWGMFSRAVMI